MSSLSLTVLLVIFLAVMTPCITGSRNKRLVLHAETDLVGEVMKLREEITKLQQAELAKENETINLRTEALNLRAETVTLQAETVTLRAEITQLQQSSGTTYVRWGKDSCPQNGTTLVYKGYMAGKYFNEVGSGSNNLCLPDDPTWGKYQDGSQDGRAYIYGTEYEEFQGIIFGKQVGQEDAPCAVCKVPGVSIMVPARVDCYPGWKLEYTGYLMAGHPTHKANEYVCVDGDPDFITRGAANTDGHLMYLVEGRCGALVCPPYYDYRELACAVCSM